MEKMKLKRKFIDINIKFNIEIKILNSIECTLFLISDKPAFELLTPPKRSSNIFKTSMINDLTFLTNKKIYANEIYIGKQKHPAFVFSKQKIKKKKMSPMEFGILMGIPKCCVKKYCEEDKGNGTSENSAARYFNQLKKLRLKDKYGIFYNPQETASLEYGFVPCSPNCSKALKLLKKYKEAQKFLAF